VLAEPCYDEGMTFDEFVAEWAKNVGPMQNIWDQRPGQYAFNLLHDVRPDIANNYVRSFYGIDPFYRDECLPRFWEEVAARW
jgi:hypothetical protein